MSDEALSALRTIVNSAEYQAIIDGITAQRAAMVDDITIFPHISGVIVTMTNLKKAVGEEPTVSDEPIIPEGES